MLKKPIAEQGTLLGNYFSDWKGSLDQIDDVCVVGVKMN